MGKTTKATRVFLATDGSSSNKEAAVTLCDKRPTTTYATRGVIHLAADAAFFALTSSKRHSRLVLTARSFYLKQPSRKKSTAVDGQTNEGPSDASVHRFQFRYGTLSHGREAFEAVSTDAELVRDSALDGRDWPHYHSVDAVIGISIRFRNGNSFFAHANHGPGGRGPSTCAIHERAKE
ncbi:hypothetical protein EVAR_67522_1 [Eumeta japonica]|uniref:Uncharacterized protein n=1 Tax=Eumeta variegata TaxID=151549 RepID=A0A4C1YZC0_EUMVA|nr:hypothetical protein EVAR_67522_1 [Eumeta japonica]